MTDIKALGASQVLGLGQTVLQLLGKSVLQLHFYLEDSRRIQVLKRRELEECMGREKEKEKERERKRKRESAHAPGGERVREKALWLLLLCFFLHLGLPYANWA